MWYMKIEQLKNIIIFIKNNIIFQQLLLLITIVIVSNFLFLIKRTHIQIITSLLTPLLATFLLNLLSKETSNKKYMAYINSMFISIGLLLLSLNSHPMYYAIIATFTIIANYLLEKASIHLKYQPINLSIILGLSFFPIITLNMSTKNIEFTFIQFLITIIFIIIFLRKNIRSLIILAYLVTILFWAIIKSYEFNVCIFFLRWPNYFKTLEFAFRIQVK
jgi:hypothetical protein